MTLVRINVDGAAPAGKTIGEALGNTVEHGTGRPAAEALEAPLRGTGPVVLMIHGFKFDPARPGSCPHEHILSLKTDHTCWKAKSWPAALGIGDIPDTLGPDTLGIAFGWSARGSIWQAYDRAEETGRTLAGLIRLIRAQAPDRPVHVIAHSLGARVALAALPLLPAHALDRILLLAGAEFRASAEARLATPAGRTVEVVSVTSRENRPYDLLMERAFGPARGRTIGREAPALPNWVSLPLDSPAVLSALSELGHDIAPPQRWICHWSSYLRPGVFPLYAALIATRHPLPLAPLRRASETAADQQAARPWRSLWPEVALPLFRTGATG